MALKIPDLNVELIYSGGKPRRAVIDIEALEALLDAAEMLEDVKDLHELKQQPMEFVTLEEHLEARRQDDASASPHQFSDDVNTENVRNYHREAG